MNTVQIRTTANKPRPLSEQEEDELLLRQRRAGFRRERERNAIELNARLADTLSKIDGAEIRAAEACTCGNPHLMVVYVKQGVNVFGPLCPQRAYTFMLRKALLEKRIVDFVRHLPYENFVMAFKSSLKPVKREKGA